MKEKLKFKTFTEFCERADEIKDIFAIMVETKLIKLINYKNYIYYDHKFSEFESRDMLIKDKIWEWVMSYKYEFMNKNDLYSVLGQCKKGI